MNWRQAHQRHKSSRHKDVIGKLSVNLKGFGFVAPDDGGTDVFITVEGLHGAMNGDRVKVRLEDFKGERREGHVIEVLEHANQIIVGALTKDGRRLIFTPDDKRLAEKIPLVPLKEKYVSRTKVVVKITSWNPLRGQVIEVLGKENAPGVEIRGLLRGRGVEEGFPPDVQAEASRIEREPSLKEIAKRIDRRALKIVTIDGEDAKDLDDGVYAEERDGGFF